MSRLGAVGVNSTVLVVSAKKESVLLHSLKRLEKHHKTVSRNTDGKAVNRAISVLYGS